MRKAVALFLLCLALVFPYGPLALSSRAEEVYTDAIEDLTMDGSFNAADYPAKQGDNGLSVIQIAESKDKELFVYVYAPGGAKATSINISTAINESLSYKVYNLKEISTSGTLGKYIAEGFTVKPDALRYYDISSVSRSATAEEKAGTGGNIVEEKAYAVGKLYTACTVNGEVTYTCLEQETITVTDKYVGYVRYDNGFKLYVDKCDSWYVAFTTDRKMDKLMEADVYFMTCRHSEWINSGGAGSEDGEEKEEYVTLKADQTAGNTADGLFGRQYTWQRIEKTTDFIKNEDLKDETKKKLSGKDWILRFKETPYNITLGFMDGSSVTTSTLVKSVTILRLKYETNGKVYNLGVVDAKQTPDLEAPPDNNNTNELDFGKYFDWDKWKVVVGAILFVVLLVLLAPVLPYMICFLLWLIALPVRLVKAAVKKKKSPKSHKNEGKRNDESG